MRKKIGMAAGWLAGFALWTAAVCTIDLQPIGPQGSVVGMAEFNRLVHNLTGVHWTLYTVTDWLGLIPLGVCIGFGILGLLQWIRRKSILKVDRSILVLGGFYLTVIAAYGLFEICPVNFRPVLIEGVLEASYPSSTTMLTMCVMPAAAMQLHGRIKNRLLRRCISAVIAVFTGFMVMGRFLSGVHWATDIIGGALLSAGLVALYSAMASQNG